jgi:hypothetical protein
MTIRHIKIKNAGNKRSEKLILLFLTSDIALLATSESKNK